MGPKKKEKEEKADPEKRPPGATDKALEQIRAEVEQKSQEFETLEKKLTDNIQRLAAIKDFEEKLPRIDEGLKRATARFRKCLQSDNPSKPSGTSGQLSADMQLRGQDAVSIKELQNESAELVLNMLSSYYRRQRTKRERAEKEREKALAEAADGRRQSVKGKEKKKDEEPIPTGPDPELKCPVGISAVVFDKVLKCRMERILLEDEQEKAREELRPLRELSAQAKAEGVSKQQVGKAGRALRVLKDRKEELEKKVLQEDEEWKAARQDEAARAAASEAQDDKRPASREQKKK